MLYLSGMVLTCYRVCFCLCWSLGESEPIVWWRGRNGASVGIWYLYGARLGGEMFLLPLYGTLGLAGHVCTYPFWVDEDALMVIVASR